MTLRTLLVSPVLGIAFGLAPLSALAYGDGTPDGSPPAEETVCEAAGLMGAAYGLCVAYCEATDCDTHPDDNACTKLRANYAKITGDFTLPCDAGVPFPPQ